jgi:hypothetical protein
VVLTRRDPGKALVWPISRFLPAQLLLHDPLCTGFRGGPVTWEALESGGPASGPPIHPERFNVRFNDRHQETVDAMTCHSAQSGRYNVVRRIPPNCGDQRSHVENCFAGVGRGAACADVRLTRVASFDAARGESLNPYPLPPGLFKAR